MLDTGQCDWFINHVFFVPQHPTKSDENFDTRFLLEELLKAATDFKHQLPLDYQPSWARVVSSLDNWSQVHQDASHDAEKIQESIARMKSQESLLLHLRPQNAALLLHKDAHGTVFEAFEVQTMNENVLMTRDSLVCTFPACGVHLPAFRMSDPPFLEQLSITLSEYASQSTAFSVEQVRKHGTKVNECRESGNPVLVGEVLMPILLSQGSPFDSQVITKHMRDDVVWNSSLLPWRRSTAWTAIKISLHLALLKLYGLPNGTNLYKNFILYFMCRVAGTILSSYPPLATMHAVCTRLASRLNKLDNSVYGFVEQLSLKTTKDSSAKLMQARNDIEAQEDITLPAIPLEQVSIDYNLGAADVQLRAIWERGKRQFKRKPGNFKPITSTRPVIHHDSLPDVAIFAQTSNGMYTLNAFETWVADHLTVHLERHITQGLDSATLSAYITQYHGMAHKCYKDDPELLSLMFLTIFELWVALDKVTLDEYPILRSYKPPIAATVLSFLLLPDLTQMSRLRKVEQYFETREATADPQSPTVFEVNTPRSLSNRFFDAESSMQSFRQQIERRAKKARHDTRIELAALQQRRKDLLREASTMKHDRFTFRRGPSKGRTVHDRKCERCALEKEAGGLCIDVFESAIPDALLHAKSAVFWLQPPSSLTHWFSATWAIMCDILGLTHPLTGQPKGELSNAKGLQYCRDDIRVHPRLVLASRTKTFCQTHYKSMKVSEIAKHKQILMPHGGEYILYDTERRIWLTEIDVKSTAVHLGCPPISGPYKILQNAISTTTVSQNEAIARQNMCPVEMSTHEFITLYSMRGGGRLQWSNILTAMLSEGVNWNHPALIHLCQYLCCQAGSSLPGDTDLTGDLRQSHVDLMDPEFVRTLYKAIDQRLDNIEGNWKETGTAGILLILARRLLTTSTCREQTNSSPTSDIPLQLIRRIRSVAQRWLREINDHLASSSQADEDHDSYLELVSRRMRVAQLMKATWQVDSSYTDHVLSSADDIQDLVECSFFIHEAKQALELEKPAHHEMALLHDHKLSTLLEDSLARLLVGHDTAFSHAVQRCWRSANFSSHWTSIKTADGLWIANKITGSTSTVHFNLTTGALLIDGKPSTRLPEQYTKNNLYRSIFGTRMIEIVPSTLASMEYQSKNTYAGHDVFFGFVDTNLLIRIRKDGIIHEVVPPGILKGLVPPLLLEDTILLMHMASSRIELRPRSTIWRDDSESWVLTIAQPSTAAPTIQKGSEYFVHRDSSVGRAICDCLQSFECPEYIHILYDSTAKQVSAYLPRYRLNFLVTPEGQLKCRELSGFVARNQGLGTLYGLTSRLLLQSDLKSSADLGLTQSLLIPYGQCSLKTQGTHLKISARPTVGVDSHSFFKYRVDTRLGQLLAEGDVEAHLYKAYLHAITSLPVPDRFIKRTGTEEALSALTDALTKTTVPLSDRARFILERLKELTPVHTFYPEGVRTMHHCRWQPTLSWISQHSSFFDLSAEIINHNARANMLYDRSHHQILQYGGAHELLTKMCSDAERYYPPSSLFHNTHLKTDKVYITRLQTSASVVYDMAMYVTAWQPAIGTVEDTYEMLQQWGHVSGFGASIVDFDLSGMISLDIRERWPMLLHDVHSSTCIDKNWFLFKYCTIVFGNPDHVKKLKVLLAFAMCQDLRALPAPAEQDYQLSLGHTISRSELEQLLQTHALDFEPMEVTDSDDDDTDHDITKRSRIRQKNLRNERLHVEGVSQGKHFIIDKLQCRWPICRIRLDADISIEYFDVRDLEIELNAKLEVWHANFLLLKLCQQYDAVLRRISWPMCEVRMPKVGTSVPKHAQRRFTQQPSMLGLMQSIPEVIALPQAPHLRLDEDLSRLTDFEKSLHVVPIDSRASHAEAALVSLVHDLEASKIRGRADYGRALSDSLTSYRELNEVNPNAFSPPTQELLLQKLVQMRRHITAILDKFNALLRPQTASQQALDSINAWPKVTELNLLRLLSRQYKAQLPRNWAEAVLTFAKAITAQQRVERMIWYLRLGDQYALRRELENIGHAAWCIKSKPEWLLLEIQNNLLIRPVQIKVAEEMMASENIVLLLSMGEGKSSLILPMIASALADGTKLVRLIVMKALSTEMLRALSTSLSGLVGRPIFFLPVSRKTKLNCLEAESLEGLYKDCKATGGVLLSLPEHLNSFKLLGIDKLSAGKGEERLAQQLLDTQKWLDCHARDIMDESDELLRNEYELVYTNGHATALTGGSRRWSIILDILTSIQRSATDMVSSAPELFEYQASIASQFPQLRVLTDVGSTILLDTVVKAIFSGQLPSLSIGYLTEDSTRCLTNFFMRPNVSSEDLGLVHSTFDNESLRQQLYLIRGLLACGVLGSAFQKRWHVNYGLDRSRCLSAVPYRAKSTPAPAAEYAQPETMLLLTTLSYYYEGLTIEDVRHCLTQLCKSSDPDDEYRGWVRGSELPTRYRSVRSVNLEDTNCLDIIHKHLHKSKQLVDFFLKTKVFVREAKEFDFKLTTTAWDLCDPSGGKITTGFSGTSDNVLPLLIKQKNLSELQYTVASVLVKILGPESNRYLCASDTQGHRLESSALLEFIVSQCSDLSVMIDVGAQFLESNRDVAARWLHVRPDKRAVVFFNENDEKVVLDASGRIERWASSPYREQVPGCLIYLDEFHTRGTDFQLPDDFRAVVLLGPNLQKDTFVQAAMRLRKLGHGQSLVFVAGPEVDLKIRQANNLGKTEKVTTEHIVAWTIHNSCAAQQSQYSLWLLRGLGHSQRRIALTEHVAQNGLVRDRNTFLNLMKEVESRPVTELYKVFDGTKAHGYTFGLSGPDDVVVRTLLKKYDDTPAIDLQLYNSEEEQEREILHEVEQEREVQRPALVNAQRRLINQELLTYISTDDTFAFESQLLMKKTNTQSCFDLFRQTSLRNSHDLSKWPRVVLATQGFLSAVSRLGSSTVDDYLRPVSYCLKHKNHPTLILVSPDEANEYIHLVRASTQFTLFVYAAKVNKAMHTFTEMDIYRVPHRRDTVEIHPQVLACLRLFSGQLYFGNMREYQDFCTFLGLWDGVRPILPGELVGRDGFIHSQARSGLSWHCTFTKSPVEIVKRFIAMRRQGTEFAHTHVGRVLDGKLLGGVDFESSKEYREERDEADVDK